MFCPNCGNQMSDGAKFCANCGWSKGKSANKQSAKGLVIEKKIVKPLLVVLAVVVIGLIVYNMPIPKGKVYEFSKISKVKSIMEYAKDKHFSNFTVDKFDTVKFGSYPQSDESGNKKEPIEWIVLEREGNKALLLSKYILDANQYDKGSYPWEVCGLRKWINNDFFYTAFTDSEQSRIQTTYVINDYRNVDGIYGGNDTNDRVFLLSWQEVQKYLYEHKPQATKATNFAKDINNDGEKLYVIETSEWYDGNSSFWLRTPGNKYKPAQCVEPGGGLYGASITVIISGVRPAIWVSY